VLGLLSITLISLVAGCLRVRYNRGLPGGSELLELATTHEVEGERSVRERGSGDILVALREPQTSTMCLVKLRDQIENWIDLSMAPTVFCHLLLLMWKLP